MRLRYWAEGPAGHSQVHVLGEWEEGELLVEPVEQSVVLADMQQQARAATPVLLMQLKEKIFGVRHAPGTRDCVRL